MSHSTHVGFNCPLAPDRAKASSNLDPSLMLTGFRKGLVMPLPLPQRGVGHCRIISPIRDDRPRSEGGRVLFLLSLTVGVGHILTQRSRLTVLFVSKFSTSELVDLRSMWSCAVGVGIECVGFCVIPSA